MSQYVKKSLFYIYSSFCKCVSAFNTVIAIHKGTESNSSSQGQQLGFPWSLTAIIKAILRIRRYRWLLGITRLNVYVVNVVATIKTLNCRHWTASVCAISSVESPRKFKYRLNIRTIIIFNLQRFVR